MKTLKEYAEMIKDKTCNWCGEELPDLIDTYEHKYGWDVEGFPTKQWLSVHCPKCDYDWSLWKLGVDRVSYLDDPYPKVKR